VFVEANFSMACWTTEEKPNEHDAEDHSDAGIPGIEEWQLYRDAETAPAARALERPDRSRQAADKRYAARVAGAGFDSK